VVVDAALPREDRLVRITSARSRLSPAAIASAILTTVLLIGLTSGTAAAATLKSPKCDATNVRTGPGVGYTKKASLKSSAVVTVVAKVSGGHYGARCAGTWYSGYKWLRISAINGVSVKSRYGVKYLYGAGRLFRTVTIATPTPAPTDTPAPTPTATDAPPAGPDPSTAPSADPSPAPSADPSAAPSDAPSVAPSADPSPDPSAEPSAEPSAPPPPATSGPWETAPTTLGDTVTFYGRGYGHGVGLSQYGAYGRAVAGQDAATILGHYYPGTTLGTMANSNVRVLVLDTFTATSSSPLRIYGRVGTWTIDGIGATFPADAQLRMYPDASAASGFHLTVIGPDTSTLWSGAAPSTSFFVRPSGSLSLLQLYSKPTSYDRFRGSLRIKVQSGGTLRVINWVAMEDYLLGVVPSEMPASWPAEALRSQAITARSYAAYALHPSSGAFDVYDDTHSQVYHGQLGEKSSTTAAINATAGQIVTYKGAVADTLFHSGDGGWTENNENVFVSSSGAIIAGTYPYLRGSSDRAPDGSSYDQASPYSTWHTATYSRLQLEAVFDADSRTNVGTLVALDLTNRGVSGRLISVTLIGADGTTKTVSGAVFLDLQRRDAERRPADAEHPLRPRPDPLADRR
jgi:stage II sporulation protein D